MAIASPTATLTFQRIIAAPAEQIYRSFTNRDWLRDWFSDDAHLNPTIGGHLLLTWQSGHHVYGEYTALTPNEEISFTWRARGSGTNAKVVIRIRRLEHESTIDVTINTIGDDMHVQTLEEEWTRALDNLVSVLESGIDRRITDRVIIGIYPDTLDAETIAHLGVPTTEGLRIGGLVPNFSAEAAGLKVNDIITELDGLAITNQFSISQAIMGKKPGDTVSIAYYRGAQKYTTQAVLKGYPIPNIAASFTALAEQVAVEYQRYYERIVTLFAHKPEAQLNHKPSSSEWNAKEIVAHLILTERWLHGWIGGMLQEPEAEGYSCNVAPRIVGITETHPNTADLLAALKQCYDETVVILRHYPDEFAQRKSSLWWITIEIDALYRHIEEHIQQIEAALGSYAA